jgi:hypothetical protein
MDPFQSHYFSENLVAPGCEPGTSRSVARSTDHWTTEAAEDLSACHYVSFTQLSECAPTDCKLYRLSDRHFVDEI